MSHQVLTIIAFILVSNNKSCSVNLLGISSESEDNDGEDETDGDTSLPYFNPRTHPLYTESLKDLNKTSTDPLYDKILDQALMEDVTNDNLLSYDPIQKWKTLHSLVSDSDDCSDNSPNVTIDDNSVGGTERLDRSMSVQEKDGNKYSVSARARSLTLPSQFKNLKDDLDELLQVERQIEDHDRVYHTVNSILPLSSDSPDENKNLNLSPCTNITSNPPAIETIESHTVQNDKSGRKFTVDKLSEKRNSTATVSFKLGAYDSSKHPIDQVDITPCPNHEKKEGKVEKRKGPRALKRRHGKRMDKKKLKRRSSINGHW